ncbi:MAG: flagellar hook assembly protein FlgD [Cognatishimia sp.]|uniref:flagellar hook assembly protein FlgD n=1 Tax=Cognatishimia sp. TaxID=2211648 RepID=UPI004058E9E4
MDAVSGNNLVNQTGSNSGSSLSALSEDYERFLTLLTAQIQYQDPLEPMDSTQFVTQLAQLSQVEQAVATNTNLENLGTKIGSLVSVAGADMIGRNVTFESSQFGLESGATDATYTIPEGTSSLTVDILDENGTVIRQLTELSTDHTKIHTLDWDGKDAAGNSLLDGEYFMRVNALDAQLQAISGSSTYRKATVEQVLFSNGENYFTLDSGQQIQSDKVLAAS